MKHLNDRQSELYANLMNLCQVSEAFFFKDHTWCSEDETVHIYRIFNYRLASYSEWLHPDALECRGHTFEVDSVGNAIQMCCWSPNKFFNDGENPMTMGLDYHEPKQVMVKMDGSLISTLKFHDTLVLKSKGSLTSDQAIAAMAWVNRPENHAFRSDLYKLANLWDYTVNMEWVAPENRIVIGYEEPALVVLSVRDNADGRYVTKEELIHNSFDTIVYRWVETLDVHDPLQFVKDIAGMTGIEGFVIELASGQYVKIKCEAYLALHKTKDSITTPRRLYEVILNEAADDLKGLFHDDKVAMKMIEEMEEKVSHLYNHLVATVEKFYDTNKHLERKEYAILGQKELTQLQFGLAMNKWQEKPVDYKQFMISKWKEFSIKDEKAEEVVED